MENEVGKFQGVVYEYDVKKGFGFINITHELTGNEYTLIPSKMDQVFVHHRSIEPSKDGFKKLFADQAVEFVLIKRDRGFAAKDLLIIGEGETLDKFKEFTRFGTKKKLEDNKKQDADTCFNKESFNKSGNI